MTAPRSREDLFETHPETFGALADDGNGLPCVWLNHYRCDCGEEWEDEWSCQCDDRCPECNTAISPHESEWIGPEDEELQELWENLPEDGWRP